MKELIEEIKEIEFTTGENFDFNLEREFKLLSKFLNKTQQEILKKDFKHFLKKGKFLVHNSVAGGLLFLKVPERIENMRIEYLSELNELKLSVEFSNSIRRQENIKYKPDAGKIAKTTWVMEGVFPNFIKYESSIKSALITILGKIVKHLCEYGQTNFAYMKIENEFEIEIVMDDELQSKLNVEIN